MNISDISTVASGLAGKAIDQVIGPLGGPMTMFGALMQYFNSAALLLGSAVILYILVSGILKTAHESEVLGRQWSSMWVPLRVALALLALAPIHNGYSLAQVSIVAFVKTSSTVTDAMWSAVASRLATGDLAAFNPPVPASTGPTFAKIIEQQACMLAINSDSASAAKADGEPAAQLALVTSAQSLISSDASGQWPYGVCGGFWWPAATGAGAAVTKAQQTAILNAQNALRPALAALAKGKPGSIASAVRTYDSFKNEWWSASMAGKSATTNTTAADAVAIALDGWAGAGVFYQRLGVATHDAIAASSTTPNAVSIREDLLPATYQQTYTQLKLAAQEAQQQLAQATTGSTPSTEDAGGIGWLLHPFQSLQSTLIDTIHTQPDPMLRMQTMGHIMLDTWWSVNTVSTASKLIPGPVAKAAGAAMPDNSSGFMVALLIIGAALAYVIPMIPYIFFTLSTVAWLASLVTAIIATPIWTIAHATPAGHDAFGSGEKGYLALLDLLLRPPLMLIGLLIGLVLTTAGDTLISSGLAQAMASTQTTSITGLVGMLIGLGIYLVMSASVVFFSFRLIHTLPAGVMRWIGAESDGSAIGGSTFVGMAGQVVTQKIASGAGAGTGLGGKLAGMVKTPGKMPGNGELMG